MHVVAHFVVFVLPLWHCTYQRMVGCLDSCLDGGGKWRRLVVGLGWNPTNSREGGPKCRKEK